MHVPVLIMVGADKGGVGKTMVTRALLDYIVARSSVKAPKIFDTQAPAGSLKRFCRDAELVDLSKVPGQMKVFDGLREAGVTVVDIKADMLSPTLKALSDTGLLADVATSRFQLVVVHVLGPTVASLKEIGATAGYLIDGGTHILVKNMASDSQFFEWDKATYSSYFDAIDAAALITVPHLDEMACEVVDGAAVSFAAFARDSANRSRVLCGYVNNWLRLTWAEFDRAGLKNFLSE